MKISNATHEYRELLSYGKWAGKWQYDQGSDRYRKSIVSALTVINCLLLAGLLTLASFILGGCGTAYGAEINISAIESIESSGCKELIGRDGLSYGCHQLTKGVVDEWNERHAEKFSHQDMMHYDNSLKVTKWYLEKRIPQMLRHYGLPVTVENVLVSYNCGISCAIKGRRPPVTAAYLKKYARLTQ